MSRPTVARGCLRLYKVVDGSREELASADVTVTANAWHTLEARARGAALTVAWDGADVISSTDATFDKGKVGLWTKADSITAFDKLEAIAQ